MTAALYEEIDRLRAEVQELRGGQLRWPADWKLTRSETIALRLITARPIATVDALMAALYGGRPNDEPDVATLRVFIMRLRQKLRPRGFDIKTHWGVGYEMPAEHRKKLREIAGGPVRPVTKLSCFCDCN